jgi:hypothetical protein
VLLIAVPQPAGCRFQHRIISLGGVADERIGLVEGGVVRGIARKLGIETLSFGGSRLLAVERPSVRRRIAFDRDRRVGLLALLARIVSE